MGKEEGLHHALVYDVEFAVGTAGDDDVVLPAQGVDVAGELFLDVVDVLAQPEVPHAQSLAVAASNADLVALLAERNILYLLFPPRVRDIQRRCRGDQAVRRNRPELFSRRALEIEHFDLVA